MTQPPFPGGPTPADLAAAKAELQATMAAAREALDRRRAVPVHTPSEREELHRDALTGSLGPQMQELARRIETGEDSWGEVFEGTSPAAGLLSGHLDRMALEHGEEIRTALEDDEDFDPLAPDPELE